MSTLWKVDERKLEVREVGKHATDADRDTEGDVIYSNTHFKSEDNAWVKLESTAIAFVRINGNQVARAQRELLEANARAGAASAALDRVLKLIEKRKEGKQ